MRPGRGKGIGGREGEGKGKMEKEGREKKERNAKRKTCEKEEEGEKRNLHYQRVIRKWGKRGPRSDKERASSVLACRGGAWEMR